MKRMMQIAVVLGLMAATLSAQAGRLPELMTAKQWAAWEVQHPGPSVAASQTPDEQTQFFTGKPYDATSGTYLFKYRAYNPALARWTSADPSGFPDGANNRIYAPVPTKEVDSFGLMIDITSGPGVPYAEVASDIALWNLGETYSYYLRPLQYQAMLHAESGLVWNLSASEIALLRGRTEYHNQYYQAIQHDASYEASLFSNGSNMYNAPAVRVSWNHSSEPYFAFGHININTSGVLLKVNGDSSWEYDATSDFDKTWTVGANAWWITPTAVLNRLWNNGWVFSGWHVKASWEETWVGE